MRKEDAIIAKIMDNYFGAIAEVFANEWSANPKDFLLRKTAGYSALITVLLKIWDREIAPAKSASRESFLLIAHRLKRGVRKSRLHPQFRIERTGRQSTCGCDAVRTL